MSTESRPSNSTEADPVSAPGTGVLSAIRQALGGTQQDFTEGSLSRGIVILAIPMVLEMCMESVFAVCDIFFVAKYYGAEQGSKAITAVGLTESLMMLVYSMAIGISMATTATVARRIGEKKPEAAAVVSMQAIALGLAVAAGIGILGGVYAPTLLGFMGAENDVVEVGSGYTAILFGTNVVILLLFLNNAIFRGAGDASMAMRSLWLANGINLILDPCLIFGLGPFPELGLAGAAIATSIGRGIGVIYQFVSLARGRGRISLKGVPLRLEFETMARLIRVSVGGVTQFLISSASWVLLVRIVASFGDVAVAGYTIAIRICIFAFLPAWGLSNAAATLVGQNLGAKKPERAERAVWLTGVYNMVFLALVTVVFLTLAEWLVGLFIEGTEVVPIAVDCLRVISYGYVFYAWGMVTVQAFNGAGDTLTPTWVNLFCFWIVQIPLAYFLAHGVHLVPDGVFFGQLFTPHVFLGARGVFWSVAIAYSLEAVVGVILFRRGAWKKREV